MVIRLTYFNLEIQARMYLYNQVKGNLSCNEDIHAFG